MRRVLLAVLAGTVLGAGLADAQDAPKMRRGGPGQVLGRERSAAGKKHAPAMQVERTDGSSKTLTMGPAFLRQGNFRAAAASFREEIRNNPDAPAPHVGLGRALGRMGRCDTALEHLWPYVYTTPFGDEAALVAAACSSQLGYDEDALFFERLGLDADPDNIRLLTQYALDLDRLGRFAERDAALDHLVVASPERDGSSYARAAIALRRGDLDEFDAVLFTWVSEASSRQSRLALEAQSWLDVDDPAKALSLLAGVKYASRSLAVRQLRAEAFRRLGDPEQAIASIETRRAAPASTPDAVALRARVYMDTGELETVREALANLDGVADADAYAAYWYVATRTGDSAGAQVWADRWAHLNTSAVRRLEHLLPFDLRAR